MNNTEQKIFSTLKAIVQGIDPVTGEALNEDSFLKNERIIEYFSKVINIFKKLDGIANKTIPARGGQRWTDAEKEFVYHHFLNGVSIIDLAKKSLRAETAIASKIIQGGILDEQDLDKFTVKRPDDRYRTGLKWHERELEILRHLIQLDIPVRKISLCLRRDEFDVVKISKNLIPK